MSGGEDSVGCLPIRCNCYRYQVNLFDIHALEQVLDPTTDGTRQYPWLAKSLQGCQTSVAFDDDVLAILMHCEERFVREIARSGDYFCDFACLVMLEEVLNNLSLAEADGLAAETRVVRV